MALRLTEREYAELMEKKHGKKRQMRAVKMAPPLPPGVYVPGRIVLYLPIPDKRLHPNGRCNWEVKAALTATARAYGCGVAKEALKLARPLWKHAQGFRRWYLPRTMDGDGLPVWTKAYLDGICDAGVMSNDAGITWAADEIHADRCMPRVEIELREIDNV